METNQALRKNLSLQAADAGNDDFIDTVTDAPKTGARVAGMDLKTIREAIARVEAEAKATVTAENRAYAEAHARSLAEDRVQADAAAIAEANRNAKAAEEAIAASRARLEVERQARAASEARTVAVNKEIAELRARTEADTQLGIIAIGRAKAEQLARKRTIDQIAEESALSAQANGRAHQRYPYRD